MIKLQLIIVGKLKENFIISGVQEYLKRINRYAELTILPVKEERITKGAHEARIKEKEGERILKKIPENGFWVALDRMGREMDSRQHFDFLKVHQEKGTKKMAYIIGGPLGLSGEVLNRAPMVLSLSRMTLNHEMSSLVLLEQLYRYLNFAAGEKYHK